MTTESSTFKKGEQKESQIYHFPKGLPGFEQLKHFELHQHNDIFSILSATDHSEVTFITVNPFDFISGYEFILPDDILQEIGVQFREQLIIRCIVTWNSVREKTTINLMAPLIFNTESLQGKQFVLQNTEYSTRHPLWTHTTSTDEGGEG